MFKTSLIMALVVSISSCSNNYVATNLDKMNIKRYFSASQVEIYEQESDILTPHQYIGVVEGQDCQIKPHQAAPDEVNARTQARRNAYDKQANGIIFTGCALLTPPQLAKLNKSNDARQCNAIVICYAKAFIVTPPVEK